MLKVMSFPLTRLWLQMALSLCAVPTLGAERLAPSPPDSLILNGNMVGYLVDAAGGYPAASAGTAPQLPGQAPIWLNRQPTVLQGTPLEFSFAGGMAASWYAWLETQLSVDAAPTAISLLRSNGTQRASQVSGSARLVGLGFPALDRAVPADARFNVRLMWQGPPDQMYLPNVVLSPPGPAPSNKIPPAPQPRAELFRLSIQNLEAATTQAVSISEFEITRPFSPGTGQYLGPFQITNLLLRVPQSAAAPVYDWYQEFLLMGQTQERQGVLQYMDKMGATIATVDLINLGIIRLNPINLSGRPFVEVEVYCEQVVPHLEALAP